MIVLLTLTVNATAIHYYARVKMVGPSNLFLIEVSSAITPMSAEVVSDWVSYHTGVVFLSSYDWIGDGYYTDEGKGNIFYIEWKVKEDYNEITAGGISFGEKFWVKTGLELAIPVSWGAWIYDSNYNLILSKTGLKFRQEEIIAVAGGESIFRRNDMSAKFSELAWVYYDPVKLEYLGGLWDGTGGFVYEVVENWPYSVNVKSPYHHFAVSGGLSRRSCQRLANVICLERQRLCENGVRCQL